MIQKNAKSRKMSDKQTNSTSYFHVVSDSIANRKAGYDYSHQQLHLLV